MWPSGKARMTTNLTSSHKASACWNNTFCMCSEAQTIDCDMWTMRHNRKLGNWNMWKTCHASTLTNRSLLNTVLSTNGEGTTYFLRVTGKSFSPGKGLSDAQLVQLCYISKIMKCDTGLYKLIPSKCIAVSFSVDKPAGQERVPHGFYAPGHVVRILGSHPSDPGSSPRGGIEARQHTRALLGPKSFRTYISVWTRLSWAPCRLLAAFILVCLLGWKSSTFVAQRSWVRPCSSP